MYQFETVEQTETTESNNEQSLSNEVFDDMKNVSEKQSLSTGGGSDDNLMQTLEFDDIYAQTCDGSDVVAQEVEQLLAGGPAETTDSLDSIQKYAEREGIQVQTLDKAGIDHVSQAWQRLADQCPNEGVDESVSGGRFTGQYSYDSNGNRVPSRAGETVDRYFVDDQGTYTHMRTVNEMGVPTQVEQAMVMEDQSRVFIHKTLPGSARVTVISADGENGCQMDMELGQLKGALESMNNPTAPATTPEIDQQSVIQERSQVKALSTLIEQTNKAASAVNRAILSNLR